MSTGTTLGVFIVRVNKMSLYSKNPVCPARAWEWGVVGIEGMLGGLRGWATPYFQGDFQGTQRRNRWKWEREDLEAKGSPQVPRMQTAFTVQDKAMNWINE